MEDGNNKSPKKHLTDNYRTTRFNAVQHAVLSKYVVLPWEDQAEYQDLLEYLNNEYNPQGETEEYLVHEIASIMWRKCRLRLAEISLHRQSLKGATAEFLNDDADWPALHGVTSDCPQPPSITDQISDDEKAKFETEMKAYRDLVTEALRILAVPSGGAYEKALAHLDKHTHDWWTRQIGPANDMLPGMPQKLRADASSLKLFLTRRILPWCERRINLVQIDSLPKATAMAKSFESPSMEKLARYEVALDRQFERKLAMLLKLKEMRLRVQELPPDSDA